MNQILALAMACAATNPPLMRDLERMRPRPSKPQTKADLDRLAAAQAKRERKACKKLRDAALRNGACGECIGYEGEKIMPHYGLAPHTHTGNHLGETVFLPKSDWPPNFEPDPDCHGFGTWHCPNCGTGK